MNRKLVVSTIFVIILIGMLGLSFKVQRVRASGTIYIRANGLVEGTDKITSTDNITYTFKDNINDSIVVEKDDIIIDGVGYTVNGAYSLSYGILMTGRNNITVKNMKIEAFTSACIRLDFCNRTTITETNMTTPGSGILLSYSLDNTIYENNLKANQYAIELYSSSNNDIYQNTITNGSTQGVLLEASASNNVHDNLIVGNSGFAMTLHTSSANSNKIYRNNITGSAGGILLTGAVSDNISNNIIRDGDLGILVWYSSDNTLRNNVMTNNTHNFGLWTETTQYAPYLGLINDVDFSNTVNGKPIYYWINQHEADVPVDAGTVILINCTNVRMDNLTLENNLEGAYLAYSSGCTLSQSSLERDGDITYHGGGVVLYYSSSNNISNNSFRNYNTYGIDVRYSSNNNASKNVIVNSTTAGICVEQYSNSTYISRNTVQKGTYCIQLNVECMHNVVCGNTIMQSNDYGLYLYESSNNNIYANNITQNRGEGGFYLNWYSQYNIIHENNITNNYPTGIKISQSDKNTIYGNTIESNTNYGIFLQSSSNNTFYHNNIINNPAFVVSPSTYTNFWNNSYPSGGNYWSSYSGADNHSGTDQDEVSSDGIGDSAYNIGGNNTDYYPLMGLFLNFSVSYQDMADYIATSSNSTISDFQFDETAKTVSFDVTGEDGTTGFCRVIIPNVIIEDLWQGNPTILVNGAPVEYRNWTDNTYTYVYFTYPHSKHPVIIVTEFLSFFILPLFMLATLLAVIICKRKQLH
jgi:parallel beta-helix repeat protein